MMKENLSSKLKNKLILVKNKTKHSCSLLKLENKHNYLEIPAMYEVVIRAVL